MLPKKQKFAERAHIGYLIGYDLFNIYRIWNVSKNKIIKIRYVIFNEDACYNSMDIDLN